MRLAPRIPSNSSQGLATGRFGRHHTINALFQSLAHKYVKAIIFKSIFPDKKEFKKGLSCFTRGRERWSPLAPSFIAGGGRTQKVTSLLSLNGSLSSSCRSIRLSHGLTRSHRKHHKPFVISRCSIYCWTAASCCEVDDSLYPLAFISLGLPAKLRDCLIGGRVAQGVRLSPQRSSALSLCIGLLCFGD